MACPSSCLPTRLPISAMSLSPFHVPSSRRSSSATRPIVRLAISSPTGSCTCSAMTTKQRPTVAVCASAKRRRCGRLASSDNSGSRLLRSFGYAFEGLATLFRTQPNFRIHLVAAVFALVLGVVLRLSLPEMALLVLTVGLVLVVEALNTCLETLCDLVSPTFHPLIKKSKDVSAAAVLISAIAAVGVAALLFLPRLR